MQRVKTHLKVSKIAGGGGSNSKGACNFLIDTLDTTGGRVLRFHVCKYGAAVSLCGIEIYVALRAVRMQ